MPGGSDPGNVSLQQQIMLHDAMMSLHCIDLIFQLLLACAANRSGSLLEQIGAVLPHVAFPRSAHVFV